MMYQIVGGVSAIAISRLVMFHLLSLPCKTGRATCDEKMGPDSAKTRIL